MVANRSAAAPGRKCNRRDDDATGNGQKASRRRRRSATATASVRARAQPARERRLVCNYPVATYQASKHGTTNRQRLRRLGRRTLSAPRNRCGNGVGACRNLGSYMHRRRYGRRLQRGRSGHARSGSLRWNRQRLRREHGRDSSLARDQPRLCRRQPRVRPIGSLRVPVRGIATGCEHDLGR